MTTAELLLQDLDSEFQIHAGLSNECRRTNPITSRMRSPCRWASSPCIAPLCRSSAATSWKTTGWILPRRNILIADLTFTSREDCLKRLDESAAKLRTALAAATDEQLAAQWPFSFGEHLISNALTIAHLSRHVLQPHGPSRRAAGRLSEAEQCARPGALRPFCRRAVVAEIAHP